MDQIEVQVTKTIQCVEDTFVFDTELSFQIFGYDFLSDVEEKVHLLEVNGLPSMYEDVCSEILHDQMYRIVLKMEDPKKVYKN